MHQTYFTLRALVDEWQDLVGCPLAETFSQQRDELTLMFSHSDGPDWRVQVGVRPVYLFRSAGYNRARRNTASLFEASADVRVTGVRLADRDRVVFIELEGGSALHLFLFGARANVFLVDAGGLVVEAFQASAAHEGEPVPVPRAAPVVADVETFLARWPASGLQSRRLARALPLFDATLATEALYRAGVADSENALDEATLARLFAEARLLEEALGTPAPRIYRSDAAPAAFALVPLMHLETSGWNAELFERTDTALRVFVRDTLGSARFHQRYDALRQRLDRAAERARSRLDSMLDHLTRPSRADDHERDAHLIMANPAAVLPGADHILLPDLFGDGAPRHIVLDPALSGVDNAQRLYGRARQARQARAHAEARLEAAEARLLEAERLRACLSAIESLKELDAFMESERDALGRSQADEADRLPFRRYDLGHGYEAWVGKTAQQNDLLTLRHARPFDLWLHARGVPGSHVVLRLPGRQSQPPPALLDAAAALAAYHSKARGSALVPVIVVPRKQVRKPKGSPPGSVVVMREQVRLVEPALPS